MLQEAFTLPADLPLEDAALKYFADTLEQASTVAIGPRLTFMEFVEQAWEVLRPGETFVPNWHITAICEHLQGVTAGHITRLLINVPPGAMKALDVDTPVLTTWGWKTHGTLRPGDFVFAPDGAPRRVEACTEHQIEPTALVSFDDGATLVAGHGHMWDVWRDHHETPRIRRAHCVPTAELQAGSRPDAVQVAEAIQLPPKRLLIDPYVLGAWLGDGSSTSGIIYAGSLDAPDMMKLGSVSHIVEASGAYKQDFYHILVPGLQVRLRMLGLLGNKHIPDDYLEASIDQRYALLQGLMDTDGSCNQKGSSSFTSASERLAGDIRRLITSLGMKAFTRSRYTVFNGKRFGPHYRITFQANGVPLFRLARKQARVSTIQNPRKRRRYLESVVASGPRLVNCIQVEGGQYLAGHDLVATHNSLLVAVFWPAWEWTTDPALKYLCVSYEQKLATRNNSDMRTIVESEWYQNNWPHVRIKASQNQKTYYETTAAGYRLGATVGGAITGWHPNRRIVDDPHNVKKGKSQLDRQTVVDWFTMALANRGAGMKPSATVVIMQRVHEKDVSGWILDHQSDRYVHLMLPMRFEPERQCVTFGAVTATADGETPLIYSAPRSWSDPRTVKNELIWPAFLTKTVVDDLIVTMGPYADAGQNQQRPSPEGGGMFERPWFNNIVTGLPSDSRVVARCRYWDCAATSGGGDWSVGTLMALDTKGRVFVENVVRGQWGPAEFAAVFQLTTTNDPPGTRIREEEEGGSSGKKVIAAQAITLHGYDYLGVRSTGDKATRAKPFRTQCAVGNVFIVQGPWNATWIDEFCSFRDDGSDQVDDQVDSGAGAYNEIALNVRPQVSTMQIGGW